MDSDSQGHAASADTSGISSPGFGVSPGRRSNSPSAAVPAMASVPHVSHHVVALQDYTAAQEGTEILAFSAPTSDPEGLVVTANAGMSDPSSTSSSNVLCADAADPEGLAATAARNTNSRTPADGHVRRQPAILLPNGTSEGVIGIGQAPCPSMVCEFHMEGTGHGVSLIQGGLPLCGP